MVQGLVTLLGQVVPYGFTTYKLSYEIRKPKKFIETPNFRITIMELDNKFRAKLIMRMEQTSILSIGATSSVLVPYPCISIMSTRPILKGKCR
jgi:hypothetical protein